MREIHSLEHIEKSIEERAKSKFGDGVEIIERAHAAKKNGRHPRIVMQRFGQIAPLLRKSMDRGLAALLSLFPNLRGEIDQRRDSNNRRRQLATCSQHFPAHRQEIISREQLPF